MHFVLTVHFSSFFFFEDRKIEIFKMPSQKWRYIFTLYPFATMEYKPNALILTNDISKSIKSLLEKPMKTSNELIHSRKFIETISKQKNKKIEHLSITVFLILYISVLKYKQMINLRF